MNHSQRTHGRLAIQVGLIAAVVTLTLHATWIAVKFGFNAPPSSTGDEISYDSIGWELAHGRGFSINCDDPVFRTPYDVAAASDPQLYAISSTKSGPVAFRPPLLPMICAAANYVAGRQFYVVRAMNTAFIACTAGLIAWFACREFGLLTSVILAMLFLLDVRTRLYARTLLTEPLACALCALMAIGFVQYARTPQPRLFTVIGLGAVTGLSILTRSIVALWLPSLLLLVFLISRVLHAMPLRTRLQHCVFWLLMSIAFVTPWSIRNINLLHRFAPLGTQGAMELSAGYSDIAWKHNGVWQNLAANGVYAGVTTETMSAVQAELALADISTARAFRWMRENPAKIPVLSAMKVYSELRPRTLVEGSLLVLVLLGAVAGRDRRLIAVLLALLAVNLSAVAITWSVEGRFLMPQLFVFYGLAGVGLSSLLDWFSIASPA